MEAQLNGLQTPPAVSPRPVVDLGALKARQQVSWSSGDYAVVGTTLQIIGESLCEAVDLQADEEVLDVACGNGNASLAAARRQARVIGVDYVPALLDRARDRARADRLDIDFRLGDAEDLPFGTAQFDVVLSTVGVMFTADHARAADELVRVCRPGGRIGLANWTPEGLIGQLFAILGRYVPPAPGAQSPAGWGIEARLQTLFGGAVADMRVTRKHFVFRQRSARQWLEVFRTYYGPLKKAFDALDPMGQSALEADVLALLERFNTSKGPTLAAPAEYLEVVITRR